MKTLICPSLHLRVPECQLKDAMRIRYTTQHTIHNITEKAVENGTKVLLRVKFLQVINNKKYKVMLLFVARGISRQQRLHSTQAFSERFYAFLLPTGLKTKQA